MAITKHKIWTYDDYYKLDDDKRYEVIEGELIEMAAPKMIHQKISMSLSAILWNYLQNKKLGEVFASPCDVVLSEINVFQPDLLFISKENLNVITDNNVLGTPDLVIEILSPSNPDHDRKKKFNLYEKFKVKEYWIIDPEKESIEVFTLENDKLQSFCTVTKEEKVKSKTFADLELNYDDLVNRS